MPNGAIDNKLVGDLAKKFGKRLPIPFVDNVQVKNDKISVTLSMYLELSHAQYKNLDETVATFRDTGLQTYFTLLVDTSLHDRFTNYVDKKESSLSRQHILNFITTQFYTAAAGVDTSSIGSLIFGESTAGRPVLALSYPSGPAIADASLAVFIGDDSERFESTNTYGVSIDNYVVSEIKFSPDGTPVVRLTAQVELGTSRTAAMVSNAGSPLFEPMPAAFIPYAPSVTDNGLDIFAIDGRERLGVHKAGIVAFSSLLPGLGTWNEQTEQVREFMRLDTKNAELMMAITSDSSPVQIIEDNQILISELIIYEDILGNMVDNPIQSINGFYYEQDKLTLEDIVKSLTELVSETPANEEVKQAQESMQYMLSVYGSSVDLLQRLNDYRSKLPNRAITTPAGRFYENFSVRLYNANQIVLEGATIKRLLVQNPLVQDLREPLSYLLPYEERKDTKQMYYRSIGQDGSYKGVGTADDWTQRISPFIYSQLPISTTIALEATFNAAALPYDFLAPFRLSYNAGLEAGIPSDQAYEEITNYFYTGSPLTATAESFAKSNYSDYNYEEDTGFNTGTLGMDSTNNTNAENNSFTVVTNGFFAFDYEKAIKTMSNISLGLDISKIDSFFGRDLLQSRFKVQKTRVDFHIDNKWGNHHGGSHLNGVPARGNESTYVGSLVGVSEAAAIGSPATTKTNILKTEYSEFTDAGFHDWGTNWAAQHASWSGSDIDSSLLEKTFDNMLRKSIKVGYTMGSGTSDDGVNTPDWWDDYRLKLFEHWSDPDEDLWMTDESRDAIQAQLFGKIYKEYDLSHDPTALNASSGYTQVVEEIESYCVVRNIGGVDINGSPGPFKQKIPDLMTYQTNEYNHRFGKAIDLDVEETWTREADFGDDLDSVTAGRVAAIKALDVDTDYRLMFVEFQRCGLIPETLLAEGGLDATFINLMAFRAGILPLQFSTPWKAEFYDFYVSVDDTTKAVFNWMIEHLKTTLNKLNAYLEAANAECSWNGYANTFNDFFVNAMETRWSEEPESAPWIIGPLLYFFHLDMLTNVLGGDKDKIYRYALSMSQQIGPRTGTLEALNVFMVSINKLYDDHYTEASPASSPYHMIKDNSGPVKIEFGKPFYGGDISKFEFSTTTPTSIYTRRDLPAIVYNGYSFDFPTEPAEIPEGSGGGMAVPVYDRDSCNHPICIGGGYGGDVMTGVEAASWYYANGYGFKTESFGIAAVEYWCRSCPHYTPEGS